ncbi:MAG: hypothetical protein K6E18_01190 [Lachnospiraceae bacterium]|nr:hypothetical protein [Lachnospiraceae bacterium]
MKESELELEQNASKKSPMPFMPAPSAVQSPPPKEIIQPGEDMQPKEGELAEEIKQPAVSFAPGQIDDASLAKREQAITMREPFPDDRWKTEVPKAAIPIDKSPRKPEDTPEQVDANWEMVRYINDLHNELEETYKKLSETHKEILGVSSKDTGLYNQMMKKLQDCIKFTDPETELARPINMEQHLKAYKEAAAAYYNDRKGIFFGPATDVGKLRLKEAKNAVNTMDSKIAKIKELNQKVHPSKYQKYAVFDIAERAISQGALIGKDLDTDKLPGSFGDAFREKCAGLVLESELAKRTGGTLYAHEAPGEIPAAEKHSMMLDLSLDNEFINVVQHYPRHFEQKWKETKAAMAILKEQGHKHPGWRQITDLIENLEFVATFKNHQDEMPGYWDQYLQAKEYLHQTGAGDLSTEAAIKLADDPHFRRVIADHPDDFVSVWKHTEAAKSVLPQGAKIATVDALAQDPHFISVCDRFPESFAAKWNLIEKAKSCLDPDTFADPAKRNAAAENLAQNPAFLTILSEHPDTYQKEWEHFTKAKAYLQEKGTAEPTSQEVRKLAADPVFVHTVEHQPKAYGSAYEQVLSTANTIVSDAQKQLAQEMTLLKGKAQLPAEDVRMADFIATVTLHQALTDPKRGNDISRVMAVEPAQKDAILSHTKQILKSEEGQQLLRDPKLKDMLLDGSLSQKLIGKKPAKPQQNKELEKAPRQNAMGL